MVGEKKGKTEKKHTQRAKVHKKHTQKRNKSPKKERKRKFVIGIISVPLTPTKKYFKVCGDSYIASSHLHWLRKQNVEVLVIPYNTKDLEYYFNRIHGLYLPSGGAFASVQMEYYTCCKKLMHMAMKENDKGNVFPVWGCCMGFQQMLIIADGKDNIDNLLTKFDSFKNLMCSIKLTSEGERSQIIHGLDFNTYNNIIKRKCTLNNHMLGISPSKMKNNPVLNDFYKIVGTSEDRNGKKFVAIIEARHYPFYGVQWHPERNSEMNSFVKFLVRQLNKSKRRKHTEKKRNKFRKMFTKKIDCFNYSGGLYKKCNFYWHKRTSAHNKKLCSAAQLKDIDPETSGV